MSFGKGESSALVMEKGSKCKLVEMMREQMKGFCVSKAGKKLIDALCEKLRGFNVKVVEV